MEPIDLTSLFFTCNTIVNKEIRGHCDIIIERVNKLLSMTEKKGQKKKLRKLKKKVRKVMKFSAKQS